MYQQYFQGIVIRLSKKKDLPQQRRKSSIVDLQEVKISRKPSSVVEEQSQEQDGSSNKKDIEIEDEDWKLLYRVGDNPPIYMTFLFALQVIWTGINFHILHYIITYHIHLEWMSDCCLTSIQQFFSYIMAWRSYFSIRWWWGPLCTRPTRWVRFV